MNEDEAAGILGVRMDASEVEVHRAWKALLEGNHEATALQLAQWQRAYARLMARAAESMGDVVALHSRAPASTDGFASLERDLASADAEVAVAAANTLFQRGAFEAIARAIPGWAARRAAFEPAPGIPLRIHGFIALRMFAAGKFELGREVVDATRRIVSLAPPGEPEDFGMLRFAEEVGSISADVSPAIVVTLAEGGITGDRFETIRRVNELAAADPEAAMAARAALRKVGSSAILTWYGQALDPFWVSRILAGIMNRPPALTHAAADAWNTVGMSLVVGLVSGASIAACAGTASLAMSWMAPFVAMATLAAVYASLRLRRDLLRGNAAFKPAFTWFGVSLAGYLFAALSGLWLLRHEQFDELAVTLNAGGDAATNYLEGRLSPAELETSGMRELQRKVAVGGAVVPAARAAIAACAVAVTFEHPERCRGFAAQVTSAEGHRCVEGAVGNGPLPSGRLEIVKRSMQVDQDLREALASLCVPAVGN